MAVTVSTSRRLSFGPYEADLHSGELRKHGVRVRLQSQPFQLLAMLLERPGELVTREEICQKLWAADTFVDFDHSLGTAINKIREVLNDSAAEPRFVETLPRRGYRFIAPVTPVNPEPAPPPTPAEPEKAPRRRWPVYLFAGSAAVLIAAGLTAWSFRGRMVSKQMAPPPIRSLAVLPLLNLSNDPEQQFFADGMTDQLITSLAQISSLHVISRTSAMAYLGTRKSSAQIARELGVDALIEGSVVRSGNKVRITAQLIHAASDRHLWARSYDRDLGDVLSVQGEVAREIADGVSLQLTSQERAELSRSRPIDPAVALLIFKGSYFLNKLDTSRAREEFTQATRLAPSSAEAWAGLADALHTAAAFGDVDAYRQAKEAANKALEIDGSQPQALMVLGVVSFLYDWNPAQSEAFFRRAIEARPSYAMAHALFADTLAHRGKFEEAIRDMKLASALDPVSVLTNSFAWHVYFSARRYDDALRGILGIVEVDPTFRPAYGRLVKSWEQKGEYQKAIDASLKGQLIAGELPQKAEREAAAFRDALASSGARGYWQRKLDTTSPEEPYAAARSYMHLGRKEEALKALEKAYEMHDPYLIFWLPIYEEFDPLRPDPRFQKMLHGLGVS
jgi:TolB-like protein/DNA-binding winged helix-turn-helix (wHTH) protein/tetratricopeptide (TPR) repeat protein